MVTIVVVPFDMGESPLNKDFYANLKAQACGRFGCASSARTVRSKPSLEKYSLGRLIEAAAQIPTLATLTTVIDRNVRNALSHGHPLGMAAAPQAQLRHGQRLLPRRRHVSSLLPHLDFTAIRGQARHRLQRVEGVR